MTTDSSPLAEIGETTMSSFHGTISTPAFPGWYVQFQADVLLQLPRPTEITEELASGWHDHREGMKKTLRKAFVPWRPKASNVIPSPVSPSSGGFIIRVWENRTTEQVIGAGLYEDHHDLIQAFNSKSFPMRPRAEGKLEIVLLRFDADITSEQAIAEARRQGLERPMYEDAFLFGEQHPREQLKGYIVFLHESRQYPGISDGVVTLTSCGAKRNIMVFRNDPESGWSLSRRFAFVRKPA
jgi:hypothetical protein